jgi:hypothetical protein
MLIVDPAQRATLQMVRDHSWLKRHFSPFLIPAKPRRILIDDEEEDSDVAAAEKGPVNDTIVDEVGVLGFKKDYVSHCVSSNLHNHASASYWLLWQKKAGTAPVVSEASHVELL